MQCRDFRNRVYEQHYAGGMLSWQGRISLGRTQVSILRSRGRFQSRAGLCSRGWPSVSKKTAGLSRRATEGNGLDPTVGRYASSPIIQHLLQSETASHSTLSFSRSRPPWSCQPHDDLIPCLSVVKFRRHRPAPLSRCHGLSPWKKYGRNSVGRPGWETRQLRKWAVLVEGRGGMEAVGQRVFST